MLKQVHVPFNTESLLHYVESAHMIHDKTYSWTQESQTNYTGVGYKEAPQKSSWTILPKEFSAARQQAAYINNNLDWAISFCQ
jgi:hypothetical protein